MAHRSGGRPNFADTIEALRSDGDPRLAGDFLRVVDDDGGEPVVLVGVVHDHPASVFRAGAVVDAVAPGVVALETPPALAGQFASWAAAGDDDGGEMTAAADAGGGDVVGVDAPGWRSLRALASTLRDRDPSLGTAARALHAYGRMVASAVRGRLAAAGVPERWVGEFEATHDYDCPADAAPAEQAAHEAEHVRRSTTLLRAFDPPPATRILDAARERHMAARLDALRASDVVVAVVGFSHLDGVEAGLAGDA